MKGLKRSASILMSILLVFLFVTGCSGSKSEVDLGSSAPSSPQEAVNEEYPSEAGTAADMDSIGKGPTSPLEPEKVITTIYLDFETTGFEETNDELNKLIEKYKAYVEYSNISYNNYYSGKSYRYGEFSVRVPKDSITSFKTELNILGNLTSESTNKQDVTKQYTDTDSRLKVVETKEERLLALLEKAEKMEDIIALENQLSEVIYEKENLKSSLITLDDKVDFSTIHINIQEVERLSTAETIETTFATKIANAFNNSLFNFKYTLENLIIALIYSLPFLIIMAVVVAVGVKAFRKYRKDK